MDLAHLFVQPDRFANVEQLLTYLHAPVPGPADHSVWPSEFGREVGLDAARYDAGSFSFVLSDMPMSAGELLAEYTESAVWPSARRVARVAVLVYRCVRLAHPERCSLEYLGVVSVKKPDADSAEPPPAGS